MALVRKQTILTERLPLVGEVSANFCGWRVSLGQCSRSPQLYSQFLNWNRYYFFQVPSQLYSRGWVDPVPDPLLLRSGSSGTRMRTSGSVARNSWPLDHRDSLGMAVTDQNLTFQESKSRLSLNNVYYHSVQNLLFFLLLSKNIKIRIYITIILPFVLYRYESLSLTLRKEHVLTVFDNRLLIFGLKRDEGVRG
jgi:hypothetical protein